MEETFSDSRNSGVFTSLQHIYKRKTLSQIAASCLSVASALLLAVTIAAVIQIIFNFGVAGRAVLFFLDATIIVAATVRFLFPPVSRYFRGPSSDDIRMIALEAGSRFPDLKDRLRNAVELLPGESTPFYSLDLASAYVDTVFERAYHLDIGSSLKYPTGKRPKLIFVSSLIISLSSFLLFPSQFPGAIARIVNFSEKYAAPDEFAITVRPGDIQVSRGDSLNIDVTLSLVSARRLPAYITLSEKYSDEKDFERYRLKMSSPGRYQFQLPNLREDVSYFLTAGEQNTDEYHVKVVDLPLVQSFSVMLLYPGYTGKSAETLQDNIGDFSALIGTRAEFSLRTSKELDSAKIEFGDTTSSRFVVSGTNATGVFVIRNSTTYRFRLVDRDSLANRDPIIYSIQALNDDFPTCELTFPAKDIDLNRDMRLPVGIRIGDDYGFTKLFVEYKLVYSKYISPDTLYRRIEIPLQDKSAGQKDISYTWDLSPLSLVPEDVVAYRAEVFDNDEVKGPKSAVSAEYQVRLPSLQEVFSSTDSEHGDLFSKAENVLKSSDNLKDQLDKISQDMKTQSQQLSWEQQKKMESTLQKYQELQAKVDDVKKQVESMTQKMLENNIISPQTLEKYMELQKALEEVNSPEFQEALKKLQDAIRSLNPNLVRQAAQNFQINEEMLKQSIERTLSLIKRVQIEQKLDELMKRAEQMSSEQQNLQKATSGADSGSSSERNRLSQNQKQIQKDLDEAKQSLSDLKRKMNEFSQEMPTQKLEQAQESLDTSAASQKMESAQQQLSQGKFSQASSTQQQITAALKNFQQDISQVQKEMVRNQQREAVNALRKAQQNLLEVSKKQEELRDKTQVSIPNSAESRSLADQQNELMQELNYTAQQMMQLSNKSFSVTPQMGRQIGQAYSEMQKALTNLQSRGQQPATDAQSQAMGSMNEAAMNIQNTLQAMMQGQGSGGTPSLMQQLQQLAGEQENINALTQKLGESGALSMEQQAELARLAAQQEAIRKSIEQLSDEAAQSQAQDKVLGNLDKIAGDMKDIVKDMQGKEISQETIQRQEKILSRLLDAARSIRQRDYDNRRESTPGEDMARRSPANIDLSNATSEQDQEMLRLIRKNFPPEYQKIILKYYEMLKRLPE